MPVFPSVEWFDAVRHEFNSDESNRGAGGGTCDASVGIKVDTRTFVLLFEGFECIDASEVEADRLEDVDFYLDMEASAWEEMLGNISENGKADLDYTLNTLDLADDDGLAKSWSGDQYRQDLFFRYNQTFQYFFDASSKVETAFEAGGVAAEAE